MLKLVKQKNDDNTIDVIVKTNEGEFIVAKDINGYLSIGHFEKGYEDDKPINFRITQEDYIIYKFFFKVFTDLNEYDELGKVEIVSSEFEPNEASILTVDFDEDTSDIILTLTKSLSKEWKNGYWVEIPSYKPITVTFSNLYNELLEYEKDSNQISVFEYFGIDDKQFVRTRSSN